MGEKNATRLTIHILKNSNEYSDSLSNAIRELKTKVTLCTICFSLSTDSICGICADPQRNKRTICVVEDPVDLIAIENSNEFSGVYHVLQGVISPIDGIGPDELKINELLLRLSKDDAVDEVILATNPSVEGEATALYLSNIIKPYGIRTSRIAHGVPMGGDIEYIDELTLGKAIKDRKDY